MKAVAPDGWAKPSFSAGQLNRPEWRDALSAASRTIGNQWERVLFERLARELAFCSLERSGREIDFTATCERTLFLFRSTRPLQKGRDR